MVVCWRWYVLSRSSLCWAAFRFQQFEFVWLWESSYCDFFSSTWCAYCMIILWWFGSSRVHTFLFLSFLQSGFALVPQVCWFVLVAICCLRIRIMNHQDCVLLFLLHIRVGVMHVGCLYSPLGMFFFKSKFFLTTKSLLKMNIDRWFREYKL